MVPRILPLLVIACLSLLPGAATAATLQGRAVVIDGDTLEIGGQRIRLVGIDAPELGQTCRRADGRVWPCGRWSRDQVARRLAGLALRCTPDGQDRYGRVLARCATPDGADLAAALVAEGLVFAYRRYDGSYVAAEKRAAFAGRGLWQGEAERPDSFRAAAAATAAAETAPAAGSCAIKGNISGKGRLYHLPGSSSYGATRIDLSAGERWFCSAAEARAAGWRPACGDGLC